MKLENQVNNLELAQKLKELGVKQESLFYYYEYKDWVMCSPKERTGIVDNERKNNFSKPISDRNWYENVYSAFTVAELDEEIKEYVIRNNDETVITNWVENIKAFSLYGAMFMSVYEKVELLIYLLENKLK